MLQLIISEQQCYYGCVQASIYRKFAKLHVVRCKMLELFKMDCFEKCKQIGGDAKLVVDNVIDKKRLRPGNKIN